MARPLASQTRSARPVPRSRGADRPVYLQSPQPHRRRLPRAGERGPKPLRARPRRAAQRKARPDRSQPLRRPHHPGVDRALPAASRHHPHRLPRARRSAAEQERRATAPAGRQRRRRGIYFMPYLRTSGQQMADDVIRHLEHAIKICGEDHVGIGTDGTISPVQVTPRYRKAFAEEMAERRQRGFAAPGERADAFTFVPDLNTPAPLREIGLAPQQTRPFRQPDHENPRRKFRARLPRSLGLTRTKYVLAGGNRRFSDWLGPPPSEIIRCSSSSLMRASISRRSYSQMPAARAPIEPISS